MPNRTTLFNRHQPGGYFSVDDVAEHGGDIWFVGSGNGTDGLGYGRDFDNPCATIDYAIGLATGSQGDVIYCLPGHNETITAATSCVVDKIGLSIIGLGRGMNRPILDFDNTAGTIEMDAASTRLSNLIFRASEASTAVGINVDAHDVEIDNCYFTWEDTGDEFVTCVAMAAFDRTHIHDNIFETEEAAGAATDAITLTDTNDVTIEGNLFRGTWTGAVLFGETTLSARLLIRNNIIYNSDTSAYNGIDLGSLAATGIVADNIISTLYGDDAADLIRVCNLTWHGNTFSNEVSKAATGQDHQVSIPATTCA